MNTALRERLTQFRRRFQEELVPLVEADVGQALTPILEQMLRIGEQVEIEHFVPSTRGLVGRPPRERAALARAFVTKAVLGLTQTSDLVKRLNVDALLRRLCDFDLRRRAPLTESLFSRAFAEFAAQDQPARVHAALIQNELSDALIGHVSRDATAIEARERPVKAEESAPAPVPRKPGRPRKDEIHPPKPADPAGTSGGRHAAARDAGRSAHGPRCRHQAQQPGVQNHLGRLQTAFGRGRRHDPIPITAVLTSASVHDSQVAVPLATMSAHRVMNLYDLMDRPIAVRSCARTAATWSMCP